MRVRWRRFSLARGRLRAYDAVAVAGVELHPAVVALRDDPIAVMFDFMNPAWSSRRLFGAAGQAWFDKAGETAGGRTQHRAKSTAVRPYESLCQSALRPFIQNACALAEVQPRPRAPPGVRRCSRCGCRASPGRGRAPR